MYEEVRKEFTDEEIVNLTLAIVTINCWNRFCIGLQVLVGTYEPGKVKMTKVSREMAEAVT